MQESRLKWQCRRGMRELDMLLTNYLETGYVAATEADKSAFRQLLELPDPELVSYLLGGESPANPELARIVERLRR